MMEEEEKVVFVKVYHWEKGHVLFEGMVSTDVAPGELVHLRCFREYSLYKIYNRRTSEDVLSFKGLQNNVVELVAGIGRSISGFFGVLYFDGVWRKSVSVPLCVCSIMSLWWSSADECEKAFKCEALEELEISWCDLKQIPNGIGRMKELKRLRFRGLQNLQSLPEEIGELSSLTDELGIEYCGMLESLPKRLKELNLKSINIINLSNIRLHCVDDVAVFSKLKHLTLKWCSKALTDPSFTQSFWGMIKSTTVLRSIDLDWGWQNREMAAAALEENGSIVDGGQGSESYAHFFKRNKENHERAMECVVQLLAIRRWRNVLNDVPKEMILLLAMALWNTMCDVGAWK